MKKVNLTEEEFNKVFNVTYINNNFYLKINEDYIVFIEDSAGKYQIDIHREFIVLDERNLSLFFGELGRNFYIKYFISNNKEYIYRNDLSTQILPHKDFNLNLFIKDFVEMYNAHIIENILTESHPSIKVVCMNN